jgi:hypothetical protein
MTDRHVVADLRGFADDDASPVNASLHVALNRLYQSE